MKEKCKVIGCNNRVMKGTFGLSGHTYGYCQIHKIEGTAEETTTFNDKTQLGEIEAFRRIKKPNSPKP